jgi:hypothetical protein
MVQVFVPGSDDVHRDARTFSQFDVRHVVRKVLGEDKAMHVSQLRARGREAKRDVEEKVTTATSQSDRPFATRPPRGARVSRARKAAGQRAAPTVSRLTLPGFRCLRPFHELLEQPLLDGRIRRVFLEL